ncbi:DEAD/DEAH box helicase [Archangium gephyra]|uniref:DEAD/DEAH box helicase n=1 Tax=Archangium gephyra TaxID=48 RepID=UPI003B7B3E51
MDELIQLSESQEVSTLLSKVDTAELAARLGIDVPAATPPNTEARLRVAAVTAFAQRLDELGGPDFLRNDIKALDAAHEHAWRSVFHKWTGCLSAMEAQGTPPSIDDLVLATASGLAARRQSDVRFMLHRPFVGTALARAVAAQPMWDQRVRDDIGRSLLHLVRQRDHADVAASGEVIRSLMMNQRTAESQRFEQQSTKAGAFGLLGLYHLAEATIRTSEFVLSGVAGNGEKKNRDFAPQLRRLLTRAEEYLELAGDPEALLWLTGVALVLECIRSDSLWTQARGISEGLDALVATITSNVREKPVFSLLPSQQEALRQHLLDPTRVAVVLQMPTSAGKTLLAEFAIVQAFEAYKTGTRVVYLCPTRALATQVRRTLGEDLVRLGIEVSVAGSAFEEDPFEIELLKSSDGVVVATPEKLDLLLRAHPTWAEKLRLVIVDEAHLLKDSERGVRLELLLANLRREHPATRLLLLTPFVENAPQIANWLGEGRGTPISVHWRPSRVLLGLATIKGGGKNRALTVEWQEPHESARKPDNLKVHVDVPAGSVNSAQDRVAYLYNRFSKLGTVLTMCSGSRAAAEQVARRVAFEQPELTSTTPALRVAIALAHHDYGEESLLASCLERGVAFHHSALSPTLRYLIEDQIRAGTIKFVAATSTLAQGMNFPVAAVLVQSVHKPNGAGPLTPGEFWNIAGRAGRVGVADRGIIIFVNPKDREHWEKYSSSLSESLTSALLSILGQLGDGSSLKELYRKHPQLRPFIQYLAHAAATLGPAKATNDLEELLQASLANRQVKSGAQAQRLRDIARSYLREISGVNTGYLKIADTTGLGSFSFDSLFAQITHDEVLRSGPGEILRQRQEGLDHLVSALQWLPELNLAIGVGEGQMDVQAVARVVQGWMDGTPLHQLAPEFRGKDLPDQVRKAGTYVYSKVSQTISWGAHAYLRGWSMRAHVDVDKIPAADAMLPAYIQYGVHSPEAAVASLLGVPRAFSQAVGDEFRHTHGALTPSEASKFKAFVETADVARWERIVTRSSLKVRADDLRTIWRQMQGIAEKG